MVSRKGDVIFGMVVLGCDAHCERESKEVVDDRGDRAAFVDCEGSILFPSGWLFALPIDIRWTHWWTEVLLHVDHDESWDETHLGT